MSIGINKTDVLKVTPVNGVIIIQGDSHTGFKHVHERHDFDSGQTHWKVVNGDIKIGNPSSFSIKSLPIIDYSNIADVLFDVKYLDNEKNKSPDLFDYYTGEVDNDVNGKQPYILLTYKGTPILHTLFPKSRINNPTNKENKILPFRRGDVNGEFKPNLVQITVEYFDINDKPVYSFVIIRNIPKGFEVGVVRDLELDMYKELYKRKLPQDYVFDGGDPHVVLSNIYYSDFTPIEKEIKKYHDLKGKS